MDDSPWNMFYTGSQVGVEAAVSQINSNCGFPDGYSQTWAIPQKAFGQLFWFFQMPPPEGYTEPSKKITQAEMIQGVIGVIATPSIITWWPVIRS